MYLFVIKYWFKCHTLKYLKLLQHVSIIRWSSTGIFLILVKILSLPVCLCGSIRSFVLHAVLLVGPLYIVDFLYFKIRRDGPRCTSRHSYNEYWSLSCGKKGPRCAVDFPHPSTTEVKERIEQHLHSSVSFWHVIWWTPLYTDVIGRGHVMIPGVSRWSLTTGDQVLSLTCSCGICSGQRVNRTGFPRIFRVSPINIIPRKLQVSSALTDRALP
jgi:hypothetical protein